MPQVDMNISNDSGANVRTDLNNTIAALVQFSSGGTAPGTTFAHMMWADTSPAGYSIFTVRNAADAAWATTFDDEGRWRGADGTAALPGWSFGSDINTGVYRSGADTLTGVVNGVEIFHFGTTETVFNEPGNDVDFRVEGLSQTHLLFINGNSDRVGIKNSSPTQTLHVGGSIGGDSLKLRDSDALGIFSGIIIDNTYTFGGQGSGMQIKVTSSGFDPYINWRIDGGNVFAMGIDNSDSDKFVFSAFQTLGTNNIFEVNSSGVMSIGGSPLTNMVIGDIALEGGSLVLKEITTPTADTTYGKVYTKTDNKIYFQDGAGVEHEIAFV